MLSKQPNRASDNQRGGLAIKNKSSKKPKKFIIDGKEVKLQSESGNITIKHAFEDNQQGKEDKKLRSLRQKLEQKENEREFTRLLRNENRDKAQQLMKKATELRDKRDAINVKVKEKKKERQELYDKRDKLSEEKNSLANKLQEVDGDGEKEDEVLHEIYMATKKEREAHKDARDKHIEVKELAKESQNFHVEMLATRMMGKQAHEAADKYHEELQEKQGQIRRLRREIRNLNRSR